jgi:hypothetical protein
VNIDSLSLISIGGFFLDLLGLGIFRSFGIGGGSSSSCYEVHIGQFIDRGLID